MRRRRVSCMPGKLLQRLCRRRLDQQNRSRTVLIVSYVRYTSYRNLIFRVAMLRMSCWYTQTSFLRLEHAESASGRSWTHPPRFHEKMAEVPDGVPFHNDDGAGCRRCPKLRAPQYFRASNIDWHGISQLAKRVDTSVIIRTVILVFQMNIAATSLGCRSC